RYGLTDREAVNAITIDAAEALGVADRYGSLEAGKSATLVVTDGNILDIPTNPTMAFVDGRRIDLSNKQTKLRDKYEERYLQTGDLLGE
ncbi:MAG: amidohydrolase, partial [Phycisphaerae bacterium]|nr:amidohydrolase [Phycisphaerae bacterium]